MRDVLGRGGFGITYRAFDASQNREVAVKELFSADCCRRDSQVELRDENRRETFQKAKTRFLEQARVLSQLRHPNIVRVVSFFEENATVYLVMELLSGQNLLEMVENRSALPEDEAREFIEKIGGALEAIHRLGLLHLDIKPENVVLTEQNRVVLMDFDLVQKLHGDEELQTRPLDAPSHCGTPGYAPIEQYSIATRFSPATDIYALGATFFHLLSGRAPAPSLQRAHDDTLVFPPHCAENVRAVIEKSLQIESGKRPQNVRAFREILSPPVVAPNVAAPAISVADFLDLTQVPSAISSAPGNSPQQNSSLNLSQNSPTSAPINLQASNRVWRVQVIESSTRFLVWPPFCPCCGAAEDDYFAPLSLRRGARKWAVPHCETCAQHAGAVKNAAQVSTLGMFAGLFVALAGFIGANWILGVLGLTFHFGTMFYGILKSLSADAMKTPTCLERKNAVSCRRTDRKRSVFQFVRQHYADEFRKINNARWG